MSENWNYIVKHRGQPVRRPFVTKKGAELLAEQWSFNNPQETVSVYVRKPGAPDELLSTWRNGVRR